MRRLGAIALAVVLMVALVGGCRPPHAEPPPVHPEPPHLPDQFPHEPPPPPRSEPVPSFLGDAGEQVVHDGEADNVEREVICFAYDEFYDPTTGELFLPTEDEFVNDVFEKLRPRSEEEQLFGKASHVFGLVASLGNGEFLAVAESLACG